MYMLHSNNVAVLSAFPILIIDYYGINEIHKRIDLKKTQDYSSSEHAQVALI